jgi:hypothetical protein
MANKKHKVVIGVPVSDTDAMRALTAQAIGGAIIGADGLVIDMVLRRSCDIVSNRTWLVRYALESGATHLLFVDSDMLFPADIIPKLLAHKKEIVGVEYKKRQFPVQWTHEPLEPRVPESDSELYKAKHVGTGLMLVDLSIFSKIPGPWFNFGRDSQGALAIGEDVWFCNTARDAGFDVWVDPSIQVGHIGEYIY